ncbi:MAG: TonB-dependent receptor, partial [Acidobacteria bacterium]
TVRRNHALPGGRCLRAGNRLVEGRADASGIVSGFGARGSGLGARESGLGIRVRILCEVTKKVRAGIALLTVRLIVAVVCGVATPVGAQLQLGTISGTVIGPDGGPVDGAVVTLLDGLGDPVVSVSAPNGEFRFNNVSPGTYSLQAEARPLRAVLQTLTVAGALPVHVELRASPVVAEQVVVRGEELNPTPTTTRVTLAGETVRRSPMRLRSRGLQDAIATTPGWATEDNGLLHVRGVDDGILYVMDGIPVYERLDGLFGLAPDPGMIESINVLTGYIPPEFGYKSGGVIEVRSGAHPADAWLGSLDVVGGSHATREFSTITGGPLGQKVAATVGVSGQGSSRFLDPVHPDNLHNDGQAFSGGGEIAWSATPNNIVTGVVGFGRSHFDVPHSEEQEEAGQDQRQRLRQSWQTVSWQRSWSSTLVSQVAAYHRLGSSALVGSENDVPLFTDADRSLRRLGVLASLTHQRGRHLIKLGAEASRLSLREDFTFAVTNDEEAEEAGLSDAARAFTPDHPFVFGDTARPSLVSFYIQDSIRASGQLTIDLGVRADRSRLLAEASQWSPRIGASYHWPSTETTVRGSFARFFQPPQPENLLLASSEQARHLSPFADETGGGADLYPERQTAIELAVAKNFARIVRLDVSYWQRRVRDAGDPNVFFGTTIIFPNTIARGRAAGVDVRLEVPRRRGWSAYLSYSNSRVVQFGPVTGGLFLEDDVVEIGDGTAFTPDHDQRNVGAAGITYDHVPSGFWVSLGGRYESGTPLEIEEAEIDELMSRPGAELADFARGRVKPRHQLDAMVAKRLVRSRRVDVGIRFALLNITGRAWAYNFGNPFSGTHFGPGRTATVSLR